MALDLSDDYLCVDLYEPVTINSRATAVGSHSESVEVSRAFRRKLTNRELTASAGAAVRMESAFDVPMTLTTGYTWKPGDTLTDGDNVTYNIYTADKDPTTAFWSFVVYNPKIAYQLQHTIDVYDISPDKDAAGTATFTYETIMYEDIACRVQWQDGGPGVTAGAVGEVEKAIIILGERLRLTNNSQIRWYDSDYSKMRYFDIKNWKMPDRLDELMQVAVEARP